ncbi:MAG: NnrU family protein [Rhizobiales bacterium]|nr:NnrU family protein [Hyphomicrobiales bacterium]
MAYLIFGILVFGGLHLFSILLPVQRDRLELSLGEKLWKALYALLSLAGLGLMIWGFMLSRAEPLGADELYAPPDWARHAAMLLVLLGFISVGASHGKGYLRLWLQNPMSIGIGLWATAHLLANGTRADVYFFGTFLVVALLDIVFSMSRGKAPVHEPQLRSDIIATIVGMVLYVIFLLGFHPYVLNVPVAG